MYYDEAVNAIIDLKNEFDEIKKKYNEQCYELEDIKEAIKRLGIEKEIYKLIEEIKEEIPF